MPDYPPGKTGRLVARSAGPHDLGGSWRAEAGRCEHPPRMVLKAGQEGIGTLILVHLPDSANVAGSYPIAPAPVGSPTPAGARVSVQVYRLTGAIPFQASAGSVELTALDPRTSGRFAVTLRIVGTDTLVRYAGVFDAIPVETHPPRYCALADELPDSTRKAGST